MLLLVPEGKAEVGDRVVVVVVVVLLSCVVVVVAMHQFR
jgi:hypothetical protein